MEQDKWNIFDSYMNHKINNEYKISCIISENKNIKKFMCLIFFLFVKIFYFSLKILFTSFNTDFYFKGIQGNERSEIDKRSLILENIIYLFKAHLEYKPPSEESLDSLETKIKDNKLKLEQLFLEVNEQNIYEILNLKEQIKKDTEILENYKLQDFIPTTYIDKPGINFTVKNTQPSRDIYLLISYIDQIEEKDKQINLDVLFSRFINYPLSSLMGSLYEITTNPAIYLIIYVAQFYNSTLKNIVNVNGSMDNVLDKFKFIYGAPDDMNESQFINFIFKIIPYFPLIHTKKKQEREFQQEEKEEEEEEYIINFIKRFNDTNIQQLELEDDIKSKIDLNMHSFILDLFTENAKGIILRNMTNKPYLRTRIPPEQRKSTGSEYIPNCPQYLPANKERKLIEQKNNLTLRKKNTEMYYHVYPDTYKISYGRNWYPVHEKSIQKSIFEYFNRVDSNQPDIHPQVNAGYSGSTFMWINFIYNLIGVPKSDIINKYLLACVVSDFVPIYHSLPEVLVVFTQELVDKEKRYTLEQIPFKYLYNYLNNENVSTYPGDDTKISLNNTLLNFANDDNIFDINIKQVFEEILSTNIDIISVDISSITNSPIPRLRRTKTIRFQEFGNGKHKKNLKKYKNTMKNKFKNKKYKNSMKDIFRNKKI